MANILYIFFPYGQQEVSNIAHFVKGWLITSLPMTNSKWVTLHVVWKAFVPGTNRQWVALHRSWKAVKSHLYLCPTASEWHSTFCERESHHIFSYDQQYVSDIVNFLWKRVSPHCFPMTNLQEVSNIAHFVKGSLITSLPMTNRKWVTFYTLWQAILPHLSYYQQGVSTSLHILWKAVSSYLLTGCEWHFTFYERQSHHIFPYDQQGVSDLEHLWTAASPHLFLQPTGCEWLHGTLCDRPSHHIFFLQPTGSEWHCTFCGKPHPMTNRLWVTLHVFWKAVSSHLFPWPTGSEQYCTFYEKQSHHIFSYN